MHIHMQNDKYPSATKRMSVRTQLKNTYKGTHYQHSASRRLYYPSLENLKKTNLFVVISHSRTAKLKWHEGMISEVSNCFLLWEEEEAAFHLLHFNWFSLLVAISSFPSIETIIIKQNNWWRITVTVHLFEWVLLAGINNAVTMEMFFQSISNHFCHHTVHTVWVQKSLCI